VTLGPSANLQQEHRVTAFANKALRSLIGYKTGDVTSGWKEIKSSVVPQCRLFAKYRQADQTQDDKTGRGWIQGLVDRRTFLGEVSINGRTTLEMSLKN